MLSLRFLAVRDVLRPPSAADGGKVTWSIQTQGSQSTRFVQLDENVKRRGNTQQQQQQQHQQHQLHHHQQHQHQHQRVPVGGGPERAAANAITAVNAPPLWPEEVKVEDRQGQDTVEIALVFELAPTAAKEHKKRFCHSVATIEMPAFRLKPDETVTLWKPLRPTEASSPALLPSGYDIDHGFGSIQISITYTDDCVDQGYVFGLFCGLLPMPIILYCMRGGPKPPSTIPSNVFCHQSHNRPQGPGQT
ncbi:unnamed protein product [Pylaiella littoralis]